MMTLTKTPANEEKVSLVRVALAEILAETLQRGFHGTAGIEVHVQDGTIQAVRQRVERLRR
jgi:hypothetical protein